MCGWLDLIDGPDDKLKFSLESYSKVAKVQPYMELLLPISTSKERSSTPTMKSFWVVFCLLVLTVNAISPVITEFSSSISPTKATQIIGRHPARETSSTMYKQQENSQGIKVTGGGQEGSDARGFEGGETEGSSEGDGLIYNVDYHGVTTHPSPSPKHPRP